MKALFFSGILLSSFIFSSCLPQHLLKYRRANAFNKTKKGSFAVDADNTDRPSSQVSTSSNKSQNKSKIIALDKNSFRFYISGKNVWDSAINVLIRNYNLNIVEKGSGVITTEWDTFYLNDGVYRNKVSLRIVKSSFRSVDVIVHNSIERLQNAAVTGTVGAVWLPAKDNANEVNRIIQNMAILLNQPVPYFNTGNIAKSYTKSTTNTE